MPFGKTNGSDRMLLNEKGKSLRYRLNSKGFKMQPWRTPLAYWEERVFLLPSLTEHVEFAYKLFIRLKNLASNLSCLKFNASSNFTESTSIVRQCTTERVVHKPGNPLCVLYEVQALAATPQLAELYTLPPVSCSTEYAAFVLVETACFAQGYRVPDRSYLNTLTVPSRKTRRAVVLMSER